MGKTGIISNAHRSLVFIILVKCKISKSPVTKLIPAFPVLTMKNLPYAISSHGILLAH